MYIYIYILMCINTYQYFLYTVIYISYIVLCDIHMMKLMYVYVQTQIIYCAWECTLKISIKTKQDKNKACIHRGYDGLVIVTSHPQILTIAKSNGSYILYILYGNLYNM